MSALYSAHKIDTESKIFKDGVKSALKYSFNCGFRGIFCSLKAYRVGISTALYHNAGFCISRFSAVYYFD